MSEENMQSSVTEPLNSPSALDAGLGRLTVTESEFEELLEDGEGTGKPVCFSFGPGGVDLMPVEDNRWAFEMIAKIRSNVKLPRGTLC